jgi:hypothetical protein
MATFDIAVSLKTVEAIAAIVQEVRAKTADTPSSTTENE